MQLINLIFQHDVLFQAVKQEASQLAARRSNENGETLFDLLVFDEGYLSRFRELFFNARAELGIILSPYQKDIPAATGFFERKDFSKDRDYTVSIGVNDDFNMHLSRVIEDYIYTFLKDHIMYKWLETKSPRDAETFLYSKENYKQKIKNTLETGSKGIRREHRYW